ncbi:MAG: 2-hydroxyglutaryl-CoA dehydratase [Chloroflexi bacterium]|nr:2-hydroxyglutaryl-CoA dehydratase [Chloroflexota bacterium]
MKAIGLDLGSLTTKAVVLSDNNTLLSSTIPSGEDTEQSARAAIAAALDGSLPDGDQYIVTTGIGSKSVTFSHQQKAVTTCLARGVSFLMPSVRMVIDMGAESTTIIKLNKMGRLSDWANHDKCAAGTGLFLQQMAKLMKMPMTEMATLSLRAKSRPEISSTCAVFAESEVISHVHRQPPTPMPDIVAGIYASVISRIMALCKRIGIERDVAVTGGVALNSGLVSILSESIGFPVLVPEKPQVVAALGAALIAREGITAGVRK